MFCTIKFSRPESLYHFITPKTLLGVAIKNNPTALAYFQRGKAYLEIKNYKMAISDFTEALEVEPNMRGTLFARGRAYWKSGEKKKGKKDIEKAAALGSGTAKKWMKKKRRQGKF